MAQAVTHKTFKVRGENEDVNTCECCGRQGLKKTIVLEYIENGELTGEVTYFGTTCAAKAAGWTTKYVKDEVKAIQAEERRVKAKAEAEARKIENERWERFLVLATGIPAEWEKTCYGTVKSPNLRPHFEALGGFGEARRKYQEWIAQGEPGR